ncbi:MAG TPA: metallophosphoesterase [Symbiobacteriaceae bacterium]|nr:metallophosphoesterase [Symbiobacteriaceae bacterium]
MVRIAVISDTHGHLENLSKVQAELGRVDWLIHAGDFLRDAAPLAKRLGLPSDRVRAVVGNCDYPITEPVQDLFELEGVRILLTHGHHFGVKHTLDRIYYRAQEARAAVVVFGHSHMAVNAPERGILLFNPGSLSTPRLPGEKPSCGLLELEGGKVAGRILKAIG